MTDWAHPACLVLTFDLKKCLLSMLLGTCSFHTSRLHTTTNLFPSSQTLTRTTRRRPLLTSDARRIVAGGLQGHVQIKPEQPADHRSSDSGDLKLGWTASGSAAQCDYKQTIVRYTLRGATKGGTGPCPLTKCGARLRQAPSDAAYI